MSTWERKARSTRGASPGCAARWSSPRRQPSASFKLPGAETLAVDLLVPGPRTGRVVPVRELGAYAQAVALLDFLIREPLEGVVSSPNQVIPVKLPSPERFVLHKLFSSQSRVADRAKAGKDLDQAATLAAALEEETPGRLRELFRELSADAPNRPCAPSAQSESYAGSLKPTCQCEPSQKGLFFDAPQRHSV